MDDIFKNKPWGIIINAVIPIIGGIIILVGAVGATLFLSFFSGLFPLLAYFVIPTIIIFALIVSIILFLFAYFLLKGSVLVWSIMVGGSFFGILSSLSGLMFPMVSSVYILSITTTLFSLVINIVLLLGLLHEDTISYVNPKFLKYKGWKAE
jgi:hypothetical protein